MFRRPFYYFYVIVVAVFLVIAWLDYSLRQNQYKPEKIAAFIEQKIAKEYENFIRLSKDNSMDESFFTKEVKPSKAYYYYYRHDRLIAWSNYAFTVKLNELPSDKGTFFHKDPYQFVAYKKLCNDAVHTLVVVIPLIEHFDINSSLFSNGVIDKKTGTKSFHLSSTPSDGLKISMPAAGWPLFLSFDPNEQHDFKPGWVTILFTLLAGLVFLYWQYFLCVYLGRVKGKIVGFLCFLCLMGVNVFFIYRYGFPFNLGNMPLFSPQHFAANVFLPSLGHLIYLVVLLSAAIIYLITQMVFEQVSWVKHRLTKIIWGLFITLLSAVVFFSMLFIVLSIIMDSGISFQLTRFSTLNIYSFISIAIIAAFCGTSVTLIAHLNLYFHRLSLLRIEQAFIRCLCIAFSAVVFYHLYYFPFELGMYKKSYFVIFSSAWLWLFLFLVDMWAIGKLEFSIFGRKVVFWTIFTSLSVAGLVLHLTEIKEKSLRERFADRVLSYRDINWEWDFMQWQKTISKDEQLWNTVNLYNADSLDFIEKRLRTVYFHPYQRDYEMTFYFFNNNFQSLKNTNDTHSTGHIRHLVQTGILNSTNTFLFEKNQGNVNQYIALIHESNEETPLWVLAHFTNRQRHYFNAGTTPINNQNDAIDKLLPYYSYALYDKGKLQFQNRAENFPVSSNEWINPDTRHNWSLHFTTSVLTTSENEKLLVVKTRGNIVWNFITLFSYFFLSFLFGGLLLLMGSLLLRWLGTTSTKGNKISVPLSMQINLGLIAIVLATIVVAGLATRYFVSDKNRENLEVKNFYNLKLIENELQTIAEEDNFTEEFPFKASEKTINNLAQSNEIVINIFDTIGKLRISTHPEMQNYGLQPAMVDYNTFVNLKKGNSNTVLKNTTHNKLQYTSIYSLLRQQNGQASAIIQIPFYLSNDESQEQLDSIVMAMINIYSFIFLIVTFLTLYFSKSITSSLKVIVSRFENMSLEKTELIEKTGNDEIGRLKQAYNKMVLKLHENANALKAHERESAWREMAQQVAHEIKNPLTPLKLNIQYLQKLHNENPSLAQERGPVMLAHLELQIEQLTNIASEFSAFAKLPPLKLENIELNKLVESIVALYRELPTLHIEWVKWPQPVVAHSDRNYLTRLLTNLMQNAIQSLPENHEGNIKARLQVEEQTAIISISDNGMGMNSEVREKIFQPHFTTKSFGTGLGLAISKKIMEELGGKLSFETQVGRGSTFYITLPLWK